MMKTFKLAAALSAAFVAATPLFSQSLGDMQQDMALLKREVGNLRLEVEQLTRQNEALERKIRQMQSSNDVERLGSLARWRRCARTCRRKTRR